MCVSVEKKKGTRTPLGGELNLLMIETEYYYCYHYYYY